MVWHYFDSYDEECSRPDEKDLRCISAIEFKDKTEVIFVHNINVSTSFYFGVKSLLRDRLESLMSDTLQIDVQSVRKLYTSQKLAPFYKKIDENIDIIKASNNIVYDDFDAINDSELYFLQSIKTLMQANSKLLSLDSSSLSVNPSYYEEMDIVDENLSKKQHARTKREALQGVKRSNNYQKASIKLNKLHRRIANIRGDFFT